MQRHVRALTLLLVLGLLLTACAKAPTRKITPGKAGSSTAASDIMTVRILTTGYDPGLDALISAFYAKYPNARVDKVPVSGGGNAARDVMKMKLTEGSVDLVPYHNGAYDGNEWIAAGLVEPLDAYIKSGQFPLKPMGDVMEQLRVEGKLYELPYRIEPMMIYYNVDMFRNAGLALPQAGWTWEQLRDAARKLTRGEGENKVWGVYTYSPEYMVGIWLYQKAGDQFLTDEKALKEALSFFSTLIQTDQVMPPARRSGSVPGNLRFDQGRMAMSMDSMSFSSFATSMIKFKWDVAPMPVVSGGTKVTMVSPQSYAIVAASSNKDAAWQFLSFAAGLEGAQALARAGHLPMYNSTEVKRAWLDRQPAPPAGTESVFEMARRLPPRFTGVNGQLMQAYSTMVNQSLSGEKGWEVALQEYLQEVARIKAEKR